MSFKFAPTAGIISEHYVGLPVIAPQPQNASVGKIGAIRAFALMQI
ncbi:hypothetical protein [Burkholderia sp. MSMB1589WGS]|nr:hypothetical protein [Burkholderia sp. MSMB1589WGS]